eukprot:60284-Chlamydomonas_euryale.AAC.1
MACFHPQGSVKITSCQTREGHSHCQGGAGRSAADNVLALFQGGQHGCCEYCVLALSKPQASSTEPTAAALHAINSICSSDAWLERDQE